MDFYTIVGLVGALTYIAAYGALQVDMIDGRGVSYSVLNVVAAALVLVSLTSDFNLGSALLQVVWIILGIGGLALRFVRSEGSAAKIRGRALDVRPSHSTPLGAPSLGLPPDPAPQEGHVAA